MGSRKLENLSALDWDDSALIKAYNKGMSLRGKTVQKESGGKSKAREEDSENPKWEVGDYCRAVYSEDNLVYETKIKAISGDYCTVEFLGYDDEAEVHLSTLTESRGKHARKKQIKRAKEYFSLMSADESASEELTSDFRGSQKASNSKIKVAVQDSAIADHTVHDYTAAESTFLSPPNMPPMYNGMPSSVNLIPPHPPVLQCQDVSQNPSLCAMLTSWYMAGYYTGLHQAQKGPHSQNCCCRVNQSCCRH